MDNAYYDKYCQNPVTGMHNLLKDGTYYSMTKLHLAKDDGDQGVEVHVCAPSGVKEGPQFCFTSNLVNEGANLRLDADASSVCVPNVNTVRDLHSKVVQINSKVKNPLIDVDE